MQAQRRANEDAGSDTEFVKGVAVALLIAIPLWAGLGLAAIALFQEEPFSRTQSALLMLAAALEIILLRYVQRAFGLRFRSRELLASAAAPAAAVRPPILRQSLLLGGLAGAYLQYYFLDVHLQIASLKSVPVFLPPSGLG